MRSSLLEYVPSHPSALLLCDTRRAGTTEHHVWKYSLVLLVHFLYAPLSKSISAHQQSTRRRINARRYNVSPSLYSAFGLWRIWLTLCSFCTGQGRGVTAGVE